MILFATINSDTFYNPTILGLLEKLIDRGVSVKIITGGNISYNPFNKVEVMRIYYAESLALPKKNFKQFIKALICHLTLIKSAVRLNPDLIIGVDTYGLVLGRAMQWYLTFLRRPPPKLDYLSFEILFKDEGAEKQKELEAAEHVGNLIIQDSLRDGLLREENKLSKNVKSFHIPVSPLLGSGNLLRSAKKEESIKRQYGLPADIKLIVNFGSFDSWTGAEWMLSAIERGLPENMVLFVHSKIKFDESLPFHGRILLLAKTNKQLKLSDAYMHDYREAVAFLRQFDAGLALYTPSADLYWGKNIYHVGYASGKFSCYMAAGLPAITSALPTYTQLNSEFSFGFTVDSADKFHQLLRQNPDFYALKPNCKKLYDAILAPEKQIDRYVDHITMH